MIEQSMKASVIIATYNRQDVLCHTLPFLLTQQYRNLEIIVVDQTPSTSARLSDLLRRSGSLVSYRRLSAPNLPAARNAGVMESNGDIVIFVDDDVVVGPNFVEQHMSAYVDQSVSGVTGLCLPPAVTQQIIEWELRTLEQRHHAARPLSRGQLSNVSWLPGCHMSFRRAAIAEAGPFDEFFTGSALCEDVDMSCRLRTLGHKLIVDTRIELIHLAIAEGGCEVRRGLESEQEERHRFVLACYCQLKNFWFLGLSGMVAGLIQAYRTFGLNRKLFRRGFRQVVFRQWSAVTGLLEAFFGVPRGPSSHPNQRTRRALPHRVAP
jgi:GT2 family glycosyltransferase